jgi:hypothetical protein
MNVRVHLTGRQYTGVDATIASILADAGIVTILRDPKEQQQAVEASLIPVWSTRRHPVSKVPYIYCTRGAETFMFQGQPNPIAGVACPKEVVAEYKLMVEHDQAVAEVTVAENHRAGWWG